MHLAVTVCITVQRSKRNIQLGHWMVLQKAAHWSPVLRGLGGIEPHVWGLGYAGAQTECLPMLIIFLTSQKFDWASLP